MIEYLDKIYPILQDVLNGIGGIHSLLPFLEFAGHVKDQDRNIMHLISHMSSSTLKQSPNSPDDMVEWEILPSSASMGKQICFYIQTYF